MTARTGSPGASPDRAEVAAGDRAPFAGVLVTREYLAAIVANAERLEREVSLAREAAEERGRLALAACRAETEIRVTAEKRFTAACNGQRDRERAVYERAVKSCGSPAWRGYVAAGLGALVGGGICAATAAVAK